VVLAPHDAPALADPAAAVHAALEAPMGAAPLRDLVSAGQRVAIVTSDLTRPTPNQLLLDAVLELVHARGVPAEDVVIVNGTGMHRENTPEELERMYGAAIAGRYRTVNHDAREPSTLREVAVDPRGVPVTINRAYLDADVRIVTGFIEPHLFAGYSGGGKGVMPGIAGRDTIMSNHSAAMVGHSNATFGVTDGNPIFEEMRRFALVTEPTFLLNVTLNAGREVTGVFAGDLVQAHDAGIEACRRQALVEIEAPFDIVVTTSARGGVCGRRRARGVRRAAVGARKRP
jgi:nickel-dependent lactate racemase